MASTAGYLNNMTGLFSRAVAETDVNSAYERVSAERRAEPGITQAALVKRIIARTSRQTAAVGIATSSAAVLPGLGTVAALTLGVAADLAATVKLQTAMVLEIAAARGVRLNPEEARTAMLVAAGVSTASTALAKEMVGMSCRVAERAALRFAGYGVSRLALRAVPFVGVITAGGVNLLSSQLIGRRADAYFGRRAAASAEVAPRGSYPLEVLPMRTLQTSGPSSSGSQLNSPGCSAAN